MPFDPATEFDETLPLTYVDGYCDDPANDCADPLADLLAKVQSLTLVRLVTTLDVTDPENPIVLHVTEHDQVYDPEPLARIRRWGEFFPDDPIAPAPVLWYLPILPAGPVGPTTQGTRIIKVLHEEMIFWNLSARHCDGFASIGEEPLEWHCIEAGENFEGYRSYVVVPPAGH